MCCMAMHQQMWIYPSLLGFSYASGVSARQPAPGKPANFFYLIFWGILGAKALEQMLPTHPGIAAAPTGRAFSRCTSSPAIKHTPRLTINTLGLPSYTWLDAALHGRHGRLAIHDHPPVSHRPIAAPAKFPFATTPAPFRRGGAGRVSRQCRAGRGCRCCRHRECIRHAIARDEIEEGKYPAAKTEEGVSLFLKNRGMLSGQGGRLRVMHCRPGHNAVMPLPAMPRHGRSESGCCHLRRFTVVPRVFRFADAVRSCVSGSLPST